jgi:hypothetical protein
MLKPAWKNGGDIKVFLNIRVEREYEEQNTQGSIAKTKTQFQAKI